MPVTVVTSGLVARGAAGSGLAWLLGTQPTCLHQRSHHLPGMATSRAFPSIGSVSSTDDTVDAKPLAAHHKAFQASSLFVSCAMHAPGVGHLDVSLGILETSAAGNPVALRDDYLVGGFFARVTVADEGGAG